MLLNYVHTIRLDQDNECKSKKKILTTSFVKKFDFHVALSSLPILKCIGTPYRNLRTRNEMN